MLIDKLSSIGRQIATISIGLQSIQGHNETTCVRNWISEREFQRRFQLRLHSWDFRKIGRGQRSF